MGLDLMNVLVDNWSIRRLGNDVFAALFWGEGWGKRGGKQVIYENVGRETSSRAALAYMEYDAPGTSMRDFFSSPGKITTRNRNSA